MTKWFKTTLGLLAVFAAAGFMPGWAQTPSPAGAKVYFINLKDGDTVSSPYLVQFGLSAWVWLRRAWKSPTRATITC